MKLFDWIKRIEVEKKSRYLILSALAVLFIYVVSQKQVRLNFWQISLILIVLVVSGDWISNYPAINRKNFLVSILMPLSVLIGALLSLNYFPNLGLPFKIFVISLFGFLYYLVLLVDNIFLVVHDRAEVIPLYRVAVTWSQILQVVVAIPLFAGIFKIDISTFAQSSLVALLSFAFTYYQLWIYQFDSDAKNTGVGEMYYLSLFVTFIIYTVSFAISFFATKAFLKSLLVSSVLLFLLSYISGYLKNEISRKMVLGYLIIVLVFLGIILLFTI
ncbi:MAG: hypothetical protein ABIJ82_02380 [Patescibacteria group bacterium]|nr:hypothetical protein [Patescibacteria group bacterium]MBU1953228.1 hypothetical protein [Patescibacteria group bacterium]